MKVLVNALPKSGTNLLQKLVELLGMEYDQLGIASSLILGDKYWAKQIVRGAKWDKNPVVIGFEATAAVNSRWLDKRLAKIKDGNYISGHANYSEKLHYYLLKNKIKTIHIVRDPRAVLLSNVKFFAEKKDYYLYPLYQNKSREELIKIALYGGYFPEINMYLNSFKNQQEKVREWEEKEHVLVVRFENLIGEKGGGSKETQLDTIREIIEFIGGSTNHKKPEDIAEHLFGGTHTFRKGKIGTWKKELSETLIQEIEVELESYIKLWNYHEI